MPGIFGEEDLQKAILAYDVDAISRKEASQAEAERELLSAGDAVVDAGDRFDGEDCDVLIPAIQHLSYCLRKFRKAQRG